MRNGSKSQRGTTIPTNKVINAVYFYARGEGKVMRHSKLKFILFTGIFLPMWLGFGLQAPTETGNYVVVVSYAFAQDPGCTNEDCPPDPGCTNEDCPPSYTEGCCCAEDYNPEVNDVQRLCCCKAGRKVSCRLSKVIGENEHETITDLSLELGNVPSTGQNSCAPAWFVDSLKDPWWPLGEACGWWNQIHKCGLLGY